MSDPHQDLRRELDAVRRDWRGRQVLYGVCLTLAVTGVVLVGAVALDNVFRAGTVARTLLAAIMWGTLAVTGALFIGRRWFSQRRDDFFAALIEQRHPELRNTLINAIQLGRGSPYGAPQGGLTPKVERRFKPAMHVRHPVWGEGIVLDSAIRDGEEEVDVHFATVGFKRLLASLAKLELV